MDVVWTKCFNIYIYIYICVQNTCIYTIYIYIYIYLQPHTILCMCFWRSGRWSAVLSHVFCSDTKKHTHRRDVRGTFRARLRTQPPYCQRHVIILFGPGPVGIHWALGSGPFSGSHLLGPVVPFQLLGPVGPRALLGTFICLAVLGPFICWARLGSFSVSIQQKKNILLSQL